MIAQSDQLVFLERDQSLTQILQAIGWIINAEGETCKEIQIVAVKLVRKY